MELFILVNTVDTICIGHAACQSIAVARNPQCLRHCHTSPAFCADLVHADARQLNTHTYTWDQQSFCLVSERFVLSVSSLFILVSSTIHAELH